MEQTKSAKKVERIILDSESVEKIKTWVNQIGKELGDTVDVTQKFLVNFIIQTHQLELNGDEIQQIKAQTFDLIKALKKATDEAIKAKQAGNEMQLTEIINLIQTPSVRTEVASKTPRGRKKKSVADGATRTLNSTPKGNQEIVLDDLILVDQNSKVDSKNQSFQDQQAPDTP